MCPLVYGLLPDKKQVTYERFFGQLKAVALAKNIVLQPVSVFTDYEVAAQNALSSTFLGVTLKGCFFSLWPECLAERPKTWFGNYV